jgi:hypothetical protein
VNTPSHRPKLAWLAAPKKAAWALSFLCLAAFGGGAISHAQVTTSKPIVVKTPKTQAEKPVRFSGEVISSSSELLIVRDQQNPMAVRTFSFAPEIKDKRTYEHGEKVEIQYRRDTDVALHISSKGKSSAVR